MDESDAVITNRYIVQMAVNYLIVSFPKTLTVVSGHSPIFRLQDF